MSFDGFPAAALDFYDDLEVDNTKAFWEEHKQVYAKSVRAPMESLTAELADEFGEPKLFRPYRDVRFSKDKTPYKTHQGAFVATGPGTGWYVHISARGVLAGAGFYEASGPRLAAIREAMADERSGAQLERILADLREAGFEVGGDRLKTSPRGYDSDHPRIELLRHKQLIISTSYGFAPEIHTPALVDRIRRDWQSLRPVLDWLTRHG